MRYRTTLHVLLATTLFVGLDLVGAEPAPATAVGIFSFHGEAVLSGGIAYPCSLTLQDPAANPFDGVTPGTRTCPPETEPTGTIGKKSPPFVINGDIRTGTFGSIICEISVTNGPDKGKPVEEGPGCGMSGAFTLIGYCGLSRWTGTATLVTTSALGGSNIYTINFTALNTHAAWVLEGNYRKGGGPVEGDVTATGAVVPNPAAGSGESCINKTARRFIVSGEGELVHPKFLP